MAREAGLSVGYNGDLSRRAMQPAHFSRGSQGAVRAGDAVDSRTPSGHRVRLGNVWRLPGRRYRPAELDHSVELSRLGTGRGPTAWRSAEDGRSDRRRAYPAPRYPMRANRLSVAARELSG